MPTQSVRKLSKFGPGSFVVTVPRGWVRDYNLKSGDKLEVIANGKLTIRPVAKEKSK